MATAPVDLFRRLTNGVYVVSAAHDGVTDAFTAAWITQVAFEPLLVAISVNPQNATWPLIERSGALVINVLKSDQLDLARWFGTRSGRDTDKLASVRTRRSAVGAPVLDDALAWLECRVEQQVTAGDHRLVVARVFSGAVLDAGAAPLRYAETGNMDGSADLYPATFPVR
jgi:flavin reductase (DIM6/NTAB) family NADH-FMN oxidoreductase RutF